ncbi:Uncharacterised protein [Mycobacterium tuberculosis]|uniref:Uncharacterized protein n=1 Tax=Mycobacterium tuberculosis TaxID=1773 RepID=A0A655IP23_MYCTX|nr:Uncharacterised protein [Mycobacterium tuberculosis]CKR65574.1 Uncharacterised protein [Mycobacterium tuberculosis]CKS53339.1 Uncharacterised protein [Mycobacterium tuberculosis]CKT26385.1 Uncharacterised protein [Mycobacterium tuberculosis]CKU84278.1 Uncharacterised protein [Mycobacterium tuberculosis]
MQPGNVAAVGVGVGKFAHDLFEGQRTGVDNRRAGRTLRQQVVGHDRTRIQAHRASLQEPLAADGD